MGVPHALLALRRVSRALGGAGSCAGPAPPPPCAPCGPRAPPPCRPRRAPSPRALRLVCCPPPRPAPPPCTPARTSRTCQDATPQDGDAPGSRPASKLAIGGQDCVARRLECAKRTRRLDYEREVARRADAPPPPREPPPAPYRVGAERELARATDGRLYAVPRTSAARPHCARDGSQPEPLAIALEEPDRTCHVGDRGHIDPCAHRPRVFVEIERPASPAAPPAPRPGDACPGACARPTRDGGRRVDDFGWCSKPLSLPSAPQRCRPLTLVERLRARPPRAGPRGERSFHTSVAAPGGVQEMIRSKELLKEAGRGRVAGVARGPASPAGSLELRVPAGTSKLRVRVFLDEVDGGGSARPPPTRPVRPGARPTESCPDVASACKTCESWLSIKNIHKKITRCPSAEMSSSAVGKCNRTRLDTKCPCHGPRPPPGPNKPSSK